MLLGVVTGLLNCSLHPLRNIKLLRSTIKYVVYGPIYMYVKLYLRTFDDIFLQEAREGLYVHSMQKALCWIKIPQNCFENITFFLPNT